jgi:HSP20 family protein
MTHKARTATRRHANEWPWDELEMMLESVFGHRREGSSPVWHPPVDVVEEREVYRVMVELPGVDPAEVDVSLRGRTLVVRGARACPRGEECRPIMAERSTGPFERRVTLPEFVAEEQMSLEYKDGVLVIKITKLMTF